MAGNLSSRRRISSGAKVVVNLLVRAHLRNAETQKPLPRLRVRGSCAGEIVFALGILAPIHTIVPHSFYGIAGRRSLFGCGGLLLHLPYPAFAKGDTPSFNAPKISAASIIAYCAFAPPLYSRKWATYESILPRFLLLVKLYQILSHSPSIVPPAIRLFQLRKESLDFQSG